MPLPSSRFWITPSLVMAKRASAKRGNKPRFIPKGRPIPPGAIRTARVYTMGVSVSKEERDAVAAVAGGFGFKTPGAVVSWFLENLFEVARNPLHMAAWQAEAVSRIARVKNQPAFAGSPLEEIAVLIQPAFANYFGAAEKRASGVRAPDTSRSAGPP